MDHHTLKRRDTEDAKSSDAERLRRNAYALHSLLNKKHHLTMKKRYTQPEIREMQLAGNAAILTGSNTVNAYRNGGRTTVGDADEDASAGVKGTKSHATDWEEWK